MTNGPAQPGNEWPAPRFRFQVRWGSDPDVLLFQEVSGLDVESAPIEYRRGDADFSVLKLPGMKRFGNVTMKRGVFRADHEVWGWFNQAKLSTARRVPVTISLLDEAGNETMVWTLTSAWPTKFTGADLNAAGNEVSVESIELSHEGLTIAGS